MARIAIASYLECGTPSVSSEARVEFEAVNRALDLACLINDHDLIDRSRNALLHLHEEAVGVGKALWWVAF